MNTNLLTTAFVGALQGNLPEMAGSLGAYYTFKDKPYAMELTMDQLRSTALIATITGAVMPLIMPYITGQKRIKNGNGNGNGRRKRRFKKRNR